MARDTDVTAVTHLTVDADDGGHRLDKWLAAKLPETSRSQIQRLIAEGYLRIDGAPVTAPAWKVKAGQRIALSIAPARPLPLTAEALPLQVLYEDDDLIVIDKPAGLVVHPAPGHPSGTLVNALLAHCGAQLTGIGGVRRPGIVHRLDKGTSGVMVAAKSQAGYDGLARQFADHSIARTYRALVWRAPAQRSGMVDTLIGRSATNRKKMAVVTRGGRRAVTRYNVDRVFKAAAKPMAALITCRLETGRTHQIRVHLVHIGHPVIGDPQYGRGHGSLRRTLPPPLAEAIAALDRPCLHAAELGFDHPVTGERISCAVQLPSDITALVTLFESAETLG